MARLPRDENRIPSIGAISSTDSSSLVILEADATNKSLNVHITGNDVAGGGGTSMTDDGDFTAGSTGGTPAMGVYESSATAVTDGDVGIIAIDADRNVKVSIEADNAGIGGGTQYAEDAAHASGNTGTMSLGVRKDTPANLSGTDGDYEPFQVSAGRMWTSATIDAALPAGTNAIGKLAANSGVDIGDVDVTSIAAGTNVIGKVRLVTATGDEVTEDTDDSVKITIVADDVGIGGGTQYNEDAAHSSGNTGTMMLVVRNDTLASLVNADGDYAPLQVNADGALYIDVADGGVLESAVDGIEGLLTTIDADTGAIKTAVETIDNAISGSEMQVDVVAALPAGDNNIGNVDIASSIALDVSAATVTVDLGANNDVTIDNSSIVKAEDAAHTTGDAGVMSLAVRNDTLAALAGTDGDYAPLQVNASGALFIDVADGGTLETLVDGIEGLLTTIDADTGAIKTAVEVIDNAISGSEMQVDIVADGAGLATDAKLDDIIADTAAIQTAVETLDDIVQTEDASHSTGAKGVMFLGVENEDQAALTAGDKDYTPIAVTPEGNVIVKQEGEVAINDGGNAITVDGTVTANLSATDNTVLDNIDSNTDYGAVVGGGAEATALRVTLANDSTGVISIDDGGNVITVDGTVTANLSATDNAVLDSIDADATTIIGHVDGIEGLLTTIDTDTGAMVTDLAAIEVLLTGIDSDTNTIQADTTAIKTAVQIIDDWDDSDAAKVTGNIAHSAADSSSKPVKIGGRAQDVIGAHPEEVSDNDRVDALFDMTGRLGVFAGQDFKYADINDAVSGDNTIVAATANMRIAVWAILLVSDGTVDARWEDGAGGTAFTGQIPLQEREGYSISAGGLVPLFVGSSNTLLNLELSAAINVHGFVSYTLEYD